MTIVYFVSGASRGLGLEVIRQLALDPEARIVAGARNPSSSKGLQEIIASSDGKVESVVLDNVSEESCEAAVKATESIDFAKDGVDVLINVAGIMAGGWEPSSKSMVSDYTSNFMVNVVGTHNIVQASLPILRKKAGGLKKIMIISSIMGSFGSKGAKDHLASSYCVSKAAASMYALKTSNELGGEGFVVRPIHPGYVKTDLTGWEGDIDVDTSIKGVLDVIKNASKEEPCQLINYTGETLPW